MSRNRSHSPITGTRKLARDPTIALAIRRALAKALQVIASSFGTEPIPIIVNTSPQHLRSLGGIGLQITPDHVQNFGLELVAKDVLKDILRNADGGFDFIPTKQGWTAIRRGNELLTEAPKTVFSTDLSTRQKTMARDKVETTTLKNDQTASRIVGGAGWAGLKAKHLLRPLLELTSNRAIHRTSVMKKLAGHLGFSGKRMNDPLIPNTNQTFSSKAQHAIDYLIDNGFLHQSKKTLSIKEQGKAALSSRPPTWEGFGEPPLKDLTAAPGRNGTAGPKIDIVRVLLGIRAMEPFDLISVWENAHRILQDQRKQDQHEKAEAAVRGIEAEWKRRNSNGDPEEYFDWPTTEARAGDGNLSLKNIARNGVLGQLDYHVGRTQGQLDLYRRRTLTKIFAHPIPSSVKGFDPGEWGTPGSAQRLRKMAYSIASFTRSAKRKDPEVFDEAVRHWEIDLKFLHDQYYTGKFSFAWPSTSISC